MASLQRNAFKVRLFQLALRLANGLARLPNRLVPPPFRVMQMGSAYWQSRVLYVAADLGLADAIGDGEKSCRALATELGLHQEHLYRLLRMLASLGVFSESRAQHFRNSRLSDCLRRDHPQSVRAMVLLHNSPEMSHAWYESLGPAIRSGETPFEKSHGAALFDYLDHHPAFDQLFSEAMSAVEGLTGSAYLHDFNWGRFDRIVDVGGSLGQKAVVILQANPQLRALVFDRLQVVAGAEEYWRDRLTPELLARLEFAAGDMFEALPPPLSPRDLYLFVAVFHSLGDEEALQLLARLKATLGAVSPTIAIIDTVAAPCNIDPTTASFDMQMLIGTRGRERTLEEWRSLLQRGGFVLSEVVQLRTFARLLVVECSAEPSTD
jgi:hypothetical protein